MNQITLEFRDPEHFKAHEKDFLLPWENLINQIKEVLQARIPQIGQEDIFACKLKQPVGYSGLFRIRPWTCKDYWGLRPGRNIPSHLIQGKRKKTRNLCVWGRWTNANTFLLHTVYPGIPAPREIHDPEIDLKDLGKSIRFWSQHAIIVEQS